MSDVPSRLTDLSKSIVSSKLYEEMSQSEKGIAIKAAYSKYTVADIRRMTTLYYSFLEKSQDIYGNLFVEAEKRFWKGMGIDKGLYIALCYKAQYNPRKFKK